MVKALLARAVGLRQAKLDHERLTSLVNSMSDGVLATDGELQVVLSNGAALNILDVNSTLEGHRLGRVLHLHDRNGQPADIEHLVARAQMSTTTREYLLHHSDGSAINLQLSIAPVHSGYGRSGKKGYVLLLRDITREKSLEEERDEFISVVSHELRTPLAIAEGNVSNARFIVDKTKASGLKQVKDALDSAHNQILFLGGLVNDLAMLSRADRGKLTVSVETIDVPGLVRELAAAYSPQAAQKGLGFKTLVAEEVTTLRSSTLYVREILQNFITNALKYTEEGGVTFTAEPADKGVLFAVSDTGIGIGKADQEKLFDKFFRSEDYRTRKTTGTGLGLYVTLKLSRLIHADISVESELNKGSTFSIYIPNLGE